MADGYTPDLLHPLESWPFGDLRRRWYTVILADPPWAFRLHSDAGDRKSPQHHYGCMDLPAIKALPVAALAHPEAAACIVWATAPMLPQAVETLGAWGFRYSTAGTWAKQSRTGRGWAFGTGYVLRSAAEFFLIGVRGRPDWRARNVRNLVVAPLREHSRKPPELRAALERLLPGPRCELFAREAAPGWDVWGNESTKFNGGEG